MYKRQVPTGATRGNLILLTQTNEYVTGENPESRFNHDVVINSVTPSGVFGKGTATINGSNFFSVTLSYESGDFVKALKEWKSLAEGGNAGVQFNLGLMYSNGNGVPQDYKEAVYWYRLAAEQEHAKAQYNLGDI